MTRYERYILYSLPIISIAFEILKSFIGNQGNIISIRNYLVFAIIFYLTIKYIKYILKFNIYLVLTALYFLVLLVANRAQLDDFNDWIQFIDSKMALPLAFVLTYTYDHVKQLNKRLLITNILFTFSIVFFSVFGIGKDQYGSNSGFRSGAFTFSAIYIGSFLILILPIIFNDLKSKIAKNAILVLAVITLIVLVLSVRRSALVIIMIGAIVYVYYYRNQIHKIALRAFAFFVIILLAFPLYQDILMKQISARSDVFNEKGMTDNLKEETRLEETLAVYNERIRTNDWKIFLFGKYLFDSVGKYDNGVHKNRPLHLDVNIVLHGAGMIGLFLFIFYITKIYLKYLALNTKLPLPNDKSLRATFLSMYFSHLFLLISGGMITITFNLISSLYMGAILGLYRSAHMGTLPAIIEEEQPKPSPKPIKVAKPFVFEASLKR